MKKGVFGLLVVTVLGFWVVEDYGIQGNCVAALEFGVKKVFFHSLIFTVLGVVVDDGIHKRIMMVVF